MDDGSGTGARFSMLTALQLRRLHGLDPLDGVGEGSPVVMDSLKGDNVVT